MNKSWVMVSFIFRRKPDGVEILGNTSLEYTEEEYLIRTDEDMLRRLREEGYDAVRIIHRDDYPIADGVH